jgi:hypothetical protein
MDMRDLREEAFRRVSSFAELPITVMEGEHHAVLTRRLRRQAQMGVEAAYSSGRTARSSKVLLKTR